jgi:hypothetical protein
VKLAARNQRASGLLAMIVGVLMIVAGPSLADPGNGNGADKKDDSLPAVATAAEDKGNGSENGNGAEKKDDGAAAPAADAPGQSEDKGNAGGNGNGADKNDSSAAEGNGNAGGNGNSDSSSSAGGAQGSASEDKGDGWDGAPGQEGKGCDQAGQGSGPYASTCDGSPSQNGNGNGGGGGKPCAGCVGNADNKNPPGQMPNGSDPNNGYECDGNKGIGKGNPAHTSCTPGTPPPCTGKKCNPGKPECPGNSCNPCPGNSCGGGKPECPGNSCNPCPGKSCEPHGPCDADPTMPGKQPCEGSTTPPTTPPGKDPDVVKPDVITRPGRPSTQDKPTVLGERITRPEGTPPVAAERQPSTPLGNLLPFTGANLLIFLGSGLTLTGAGVVMSGTKRRK